MTEKYGENPFHVETVAGLPEDTARRNFSFFNNPGRYSFEQEKDEFEAEVDEFVEAHDIYHLTTYTFVDDGRYIKDIDIYYRGEE